MSVARPRCGVAGAPIDCLGVWIVVACHPGRSATRFPVVAFPRIVTWFTRAGNGEGPPQFLARVGIKGNDVAAHAEFATGTADDHLAVDDQGHQGQILPLLVVLNLGIPDHFAGLGLERDHMIVRRGEVHLVLPQPHAAVGRVQLKEVFRKLALVSPVLVAGFGVERNHLPLRRCDEHHAIVDDRRGLMSLDHTGRERPHRHEAFHVRGVDLVERAVSLAIIGPAIVHPVAGFRILESVSRHRAVILDRACGSDRNEACGREQTRQKPLLQGHNKSSPLFSSHEFCFPCRGSTAGGRHLACCAPTFPTNVAATVSGASSAANGSAGRLRGAGPKITCPLCLGSYSELWQTHLNTSLSLPAAFTHAVIGQPVWTQMTEYATTPPAARERVSSSSSAGSSFTTSTSFRREPLRTTAVLGSFGQARTGGPPAFRSCGLIISPARSPSEKTRTSAFCGRSLLPGKSSSAMEDLDDARQAPVARAVRMSARRVGS